MRPETPPRPWRFGVERGFEANRFALEFQAQAYAGVLPADSAPGSDPAGTDLNQVGAEGRRLVREKGVAA
jgi:hypothetical protein